MKSKLPEGWEEVRLDEIGRIVTGKTPKTNKKENFNGDIPFLTPSDDMENRFVTKTDRTLSKIGADSLKNQIIPSKSICVSCIGSQLGKVVIAQEKTITNQQINSIIVNENIDNMFIYYAMLLVGEKLRYISKTSTAVPIVNKTNFSKEKILLPQMKEQKVIADTLSSLDDKIELNNKINKNLEQQAQAIFKHWFIDFEFPDENGNPYKSSGGEMVESELGMIPKGWRVGTVDDLGNVVGGSTPSRKKSEYFTTKGIPWITPKDLSNNKNIFINKGDEDITEEGFKSTSIKILPRGTVLFSSRAPIGYIGIAKNDVTTNQGFKSIIPCKEKGVGTGYIFNWLKRNVENIKNRASGSTFKEISGGGLKKIEAIIPDKKLLNKYEDLQNDYFNRIESNEDQNRVLNKLRDTLLPKLMSGEIRIPLD